MNGLVSIHGGMMISEAEIQKAVDFIRDNAEKHAAAKAQRVSLEEHRKIKKARLMQAAEQEGFTSAAMQEREAYAHKDYEELIEGLAVAVERETYFQAMIKAAEIKIDAWRTMEASHRGLARL